MAPVFVLSETSCGFALFKASDKKILERSDLQDLASSVDDTVKSFKLKKWAGFEGANAAVEEAMAIGEGKVTPMLAGLLDILKDEKKASLVVADSKLGTAIKKLPGISIKAVSDSVSLDIHRAIREHLPSLLPNLTPSAISTMSLGLSHSLSRHKLKFSADKVDTMIIQAISLLDDLDKELNTYAMRVKEWYGWHFPEMAKILNDNLAYARVILKVGMRSNFSTSDLSDILPEELEGAIKAGAETSMGTEITEEDMITIDSLAEQVVELTEYRTLLSTYLSARMKAIAPNLTALVGDLVGARLISHAGSLTSLSKSAASTIQILGAEKALFRALKTKHDTPKYGLIYHASLIGQATGKNKGKVARILAAKAALGLRVDAMGDTVDGQGEELTEEARTFIGNRGRAYVERKLADLEGRPITGKGAAIAPAEQSLAKPGKFEVKPARKYNAAADGIPQEAAAAAGSSAMELDDAKAGAEDSDDDSEDSDDEAPAVKAVNGTSKILSKDELKALKKTDKKAYKKAKAAREAHKEEKKAKKEAKKESKSGKKRKADENEEKPKKKKKSKA
ncbi:Nop domain-containing protein [Microthyrium microscopicum]|uniref:Nucleolar protein 58 n=1 Tax=Microthyrium microscopicum TaxID=703497 RepID=A0A6A6U444_9PEZI|nr:Nop domain-containing protein [Microthyrium microscopicum]